MTITEPTSPAAPGPTVLDEQLPPLAPPPASPPPAAPAPVPADDTTPAGRRRISVHGWITAAIAVVTTAIYTWNLSANGNGNDYYAAAVLSATKSWKAFFFGSIDSVGAITVDKPPLALWVQALSARIFGFSSWSMLLPEALAGVASVLLLHHLVRKWAGDWAAHLAAFAFAVTPVAALMFRFNNPDAVLTLLGLLSAWAIWRALETGRTRWLVACGALIGMGFTTKMLQALVVLPAMALVYLIAGPPKLGKRILQLLAAAASMLVAAGWWIAVVALWPASDRPWIGSTDDNNILSLVFGYNGLGRIFGQGAGTGGGASIGGGGGPNFGGAAGWLRLFNTQNGGQISWLIPLALAGLLAGLWLTRRSPRTDLARAGWILWGGWAIVGYALFSKAQGIFHPYYSIQLAPAVAACAAAGGFALWRLGRAHRWLSFALPLAILAAASWAVALLLQTPTYLPWLRTAIIVAAVAGAIGLFVGGLLRSKRVVAAAAVAAALSVLAAPTAYTLTTITSSASGPIVNAGPTGATTGGPGGGMGAGGPASQQADQALISYLEANRGDATYLAAAFSSNASAPIILGSDGEPVLTIGGFNGSDPYPTVDQLQQLVASGQLRYVVMSGGMGGGMGGPGGGNSTTSAVRQWITANGTQVDYGGSSTLYDLSGAA